MRIRMWNAFASNNSGSYTLVGHFRRAEDASAVAELLQRVLAEHDAWVRSGSSEESPLAALAREEGLSSGGELMRDDAWPMFGDAPPEVAASGQQVVLYVPYTASMPRAFGELLYRWGGRVETELDHAHHPLVMDVSFWADWQLDEDEQGKRLLACKTAVEHGAFDPALAKAGGGARPTSWPPAVRWDDTLRVAIAPLELVVAARIARELASAHGLAVRIHVSEAEYEDGDPLAPLRAPRERVGGRATLILWRAGTDAVEALRAVREVLGGSVAQAEEALAAAPVELLTDVSYADAYPAATRLQAAGCEVEVVRSTGTT